MGPLQLTSSIIEMLPSEILILIFNYATNNASDKRQMFDLETTCTRFGGLMASLRGKYWWHLYEGHFPQIKMLSVTLPRYIHYKHVPKDFMFIYPFMITIWFEDCEVDLSLVPRTVKNLILTNCTYYGQTTARVLAKHCRALPYSSNMLDPARGD